MIEEKNMKKIKEIFKKFFKWIGNAVEDIFNSENILLIIAIIIGVPICVVFLLFIFILYSLWVILAMLYNIIITFLNGIFNR